MRILTSIGLLLLLTCAVASAQRRRATVGGGTVDEQPAVRKVIDDLLLAQSEFWENRDSETVFTFYAPEYREISSGRVLTLDQLRRFYNQRREQLTLGSPQRRSLTLRTPQRITISGDTAFVMYSVEDKIGREGVILRQRSLWCTDILSKREARWLVVHEHCSPLASQ